MTGRTFTATARRVVAVSAVALAACGGSETQRDDTAVLVGACPVSSPGVRAPVAGFNYGNRELAVELWPSGELVAGRLPDGASYAEIRRDGSIVAKLGWWRGVEGRLKIKGARLDASAPPLRADIPAGYGPTGFQVTGLTFPTRGCWKVVARVGRATLAFVVLVRER